MDKKFWKPILDELGFPKEKYDVLFEYINRHMAYNVPNFLSNNQPLEEMQTLPMALKVLSKLNLDKVHFVDAPLLQSKDGKFCNIIPHTVSYEINFEELIVINDIENHISMQLVKETQEKFNEILENENLYVYILFSRTKMNDNNLLAVHRYFTSEQVLEFNKSYLIHYLKTIGKEKDGRIKIGIEQKLISTDKKTSFLEFIEEIGGGVPREEQLNVWFEKENVH
jgi:hypothetical protein